MANALACGKCGNTIASDRVQLDFDGTCPWCLATFALGAPSADEPAPAGAPASNRLGKYLLTEKLGTGGMGEVWKAKDQELNRRVALKFLKDQDPKELARFTREAHMAAKLSHPGIAAVHEIGEVGGRHFIVMQCIEGRTLEAFPKNDRRLLVRLCLDAAKALDHAHRHGVIHRDIKPGNLMVDETEEEPKVVVLDFGLARPIEEGGKLSGTGSVAGTPQYLSPEQARAERLDERTDVYSLGATMYEIFTGRPLFEGRNVYEILGKIENEEPTAPRKITPRISPDLQKIILKCLEKNRERRYAGAKELADDLRRFMNHEAVLARPPSTIYRLRMKLAKRKSVVAAAAALLVLVAGAAIVLPKMNAEARARDRLDAYRTAYDDGRNAWDEVQQMAWQASLERTLVKARETRRHFEKATGILDRAEAHVMRGRCLQLEGDSRAAEGAWERALVLEPGNQEARFHLAKMLLLNYLNQRGSRIMSGSDAWRVTPARVDLGPENQEARDLRRRAEKHLEAVGSGEKAAYIRGVREVCLGRHHDGAALLAQYNQEGWDSASIALEGLARLYSGDLAGAIKACTRAIELNPKHARAYLIRGIAKDAQALYDPAIADYDEAIRLDRNNAMAYLNRGVAKADTGFHDDAIKNYDEAIRLSPKLALAYNNRANSRHAKGLHVQAIEDFDEAIRLDPDQALALTNRGAAKRARGFLEEAIADYDRAIRLDPKLAMAYCNRGNARQAKGLVNEAISDYDMAIRLDPQYVAPLVNRGATKQGQGFLDEAIKDFDQAILLNPKSALARSNRGVARKDKGLLDAALADFDAAIDLDPNNVKALVHRGIVRQNRGFSDLAITDFDKAIKADPQCALAYTNRGIAKGGQGRFVEAIEDLDKAVEYDPKSAMALSFRGGAKQALGRHDEAIEDYEKAIKCDQKCHRAYSGRGYLRHLKGLHREAIEDLTRALLLDPKDQASRINRGNAYGALNLLDEEIADYDEVIKKEPRHRTARFNRGIARMAKGLLDAAIEDFNVVISLHPSAAAYINRGNAKTDKKLFKDAIADYDLAIGLDPKNGEAYGNRGITKWKSGDVESAILDWKESLAQAPPDDPYRSVLEELISTRGDSLLVEDAHRLHAEGKYKEAIEKHRAFGDSHPKHALAASSAYSIACAYALLGEKSNALDWLEKAVALGWKNLAHMEKDSDLQLLRVENRYVKLAEKLRAK